MSHPPQFNGFVFEIKRLESELSKTQLELISLMSAIQQAEKVLWEVVEDEGCSHGSDAKFALDMLNNGKTK